MDAATLTGLLAEVVYSSMDYTGAWQRGLKGAKQANAKRRAIDALFLAATGRKATDEEHDKMGTAVAATY